MGHAGESWETLQVIEVRWNPVIGSALLVAVDDVDDPTRRVEFGLPISGIVSDLPV